MDRCLLTKDREDRRLPMEDNRLLSYHEGQSARCLLRIAFSPRRVERTAVSPRRIEWSRGPTPPQRIVDRYLPTEDREEDRWLPWRRESRHKGDRADRCLLEGRREEWSIVSEGKSHSSEDDASLEPGMNCTFIVNERARSAACIQIAR